jgi:nucleotide-binding universal stress UspA family protein
MKKILFPTDFSKNANRALSYARALCLTLDAQLILFHSCRAEAIAFHSGEDADEGAIIRNARLQLNNYQLLNFPTDTIKVTPVVEYGLAVDTIVDFATKSGVDLIVMGTKGASGLDDVLLGSNTAAVMQRAKCPVLAVPEATEFHPIKVLAFATDYRETDTNAIKSLSSIAELFDAKLLIVHISDVLVPDNFEHALFEVFKDEIRQKIGYKNIEFDVLKGSNPVKVLNEFIKDRSVSFIAVSTRRKNLFTRLFDKSFTKQLAYHSLVPVMAFHDGL